MNWFSWARDSLAGRLSLYFGAGTLLILGILGTLLFVFFERQVHLRDANELSSKSAAVFSLVRGINRPNDIYESIARIRATEIGHDDLDIGVLIDDVWLLEPDRSILEHAQHNQVSPADGLGQAMMIMINDRQWAMHHMAHQMQARPDMVVQAVVAIDVSETTRLVTGLRQALLAIGLAGVAMISALTWIATVRALAPLNKLAGKAEQMTAHALDHPLEAENAPLEVRGLVTSLNQMLTRLKKSFNSLEQFSADIAHELRTPVNALLTQTQVTLSRERSSEEYRESLHQSLEELDRLQRMVEDMLFIARADRSVNKAPFALTDLANTATEVVEYIDLIASENGQSISVEGALTARCDPLMLRRALTNLLTNAVRYAPPNTGIALSLSLRASDAVIRITNVFQDKYSEQEIKGLFDRFSRQSADCAGQQAGLGLGLSIVQSIMRVHAGQAKASLKDGRFSIELRWPAN